MEETGTYLTAVGTLPTETLDDTSNSTTVWQQQQYVMYFLSTMAQMPLVVHDFPFIEASR